MFSGLGVEDLISLCDEIFDLLDHEMMYLFLDNEWATNF